MTFRDKQLVICGLASVCFVPVTAYAFRSGPPPALTGSIASGGANCTQCHSGGAGPGSVTLVGLPTSYEADEIYDLIVRVADPGQVGAGFEISAEDGAGTHVGSFSVTDATNTQINTFDSNYMNHTSTGVSNSVTNWAGLGNAAEYSVRWQAPSLDVGPVTIWAVGNAINNNFSNSGDLIYLGNQTMEFSAGAVPTVSEWGILLMMLVIAATGTVVLRRRAVAAR